MKSPPEPPPHPAPMESPSSFPSKSGRSWAPAQSPWNRLAAVASHTLDTHTEHLLRDLAPQVLGVLLHRFRDFSAAEDAVQESLIAAASQWPTEGTPDNPRAWLIRVATRRMIDHTRSENARLDRETAAAAEQSLFVIPNFDLESDAHDDRSKE